MRMPPPKISDGGDDNQLGDRRRMPPPSVNSGGDDEYKVTRLNNRKGDGAEGNSPNDGPKVKGQMQKVLNIPALVSSAPDDASVIALLPDHRYVGQMLSSFTSSALVIECQNVRAPD
jgi:hypothetical protein